VALKAWNLLPTDIKREFNRFF